MNPLDLSRHLALKALSEAREHLRALDLRRPASEVSQLIRFVADLPPPKPAPPPAMAAPAETPELAAAKAQQEAERERLRRILGVHTMPSAIVRVMKEFKCSRAGAERLIEEARAS